MADHDFELVIGDKNWSSWSFRPWLLMKVAGIGFRETSIRLRQETTREHALRHSPSGFVPVLKWQGSAINDSLAICETIAELFPEKTLWPQDQLARAMARAASAEMHSGFVDLRRDMPMDIISRMPGEGQSEGALNAARRIIGIWQDLRTRFADKAKRDEGMLCGHFTVVDAMYAPIVTRFRTYDVDLESLGDDGTARKYMSAICALPAFQEWERGAAAQMKERA